MGGEAGMMSSEVLDLDKVFSRASSLGVSELEVVVDYSKTLDMATVRDRIEKAKYSSSVRIGYRVVVDGRKAFHGATITSTSDALRVLEDAVKVARISPRDPYWRSLPRGIGGGVEVDVYDERTARLDADIVVDVISSTIDLVKDYDPRTSPVVVSMSLGVGERVIANNYGEEASRRETSVFFTVGVRASDNGREGVYYEYRLYRRLGDVDYEGLSRRACSRALDSLNAKRLETMKTTIVFEPLIWASIMTAVLVPPITADNVQENRSPLKNRIGEQVFSEEVDIVDDPHMPWKPGSRSIDDEGLATKRKKVFEKGVLKTFLYDHYTASREGKSSTGNAYRRSPWSSPRPWPTNLLLEPGSSSLEELVRDVGSGILVASTVGEWLSNPVSGLVNATISHGYVIKSGELVQPVKGLTLSDNFYEALSKRLIGVSREYECLFNVCSPGVAIRDVVVAGK